MKFEKVRLHNMFSYYSHVSVDLSGGSDQRNIVLISGRNGYGKTSFIRCLKLLFAGSEEGVVVALSGRKMGAKRFVTGDGKRWFGIMNRKAQADGETRCKICIEWLEERGRVTAERSWDLNGTDFQGELKIIADFEQDPLTDVNAKEFLDRRLPSAYIPFFFFDSEQIEKLADSTDDKLFRDEMERLLDIAPIDLLGNELHKVARDWHRNAMEKEAQEVLLKLQNRCMENEMAISKADENLLDCEYQREDLEKQIRGFEKELSRLEEVRALHDIQRLDEDRRKCSKQLEEKCSIFAERIAKSSPLLANPDLVKKAAAYLGNTADSRSGEAAEILESLKASLVRELFEEPPYPNPELTKGQSNHLRKRLSGLMDARIPNREPGLFSIESGKAKRLREEFIRFEGMGSDREGVRQLLVEIHELKQKLATINYQREEAFGLTGLERKTIESVKTRIRYKTEALGAVKESQRQSLSRKNSLQSENQQIRSDIRDQEKAVVLSVRAKKKVALARELRKFFDQYKARLMETRRKDVEAAFNNYLKILMPEHPLVHRVVVEESFSLVYLDKNGENVGRASLSSGIKQLIATALLWALKTVSGKDIPVVIDSPLGRLDKEHRLDLLKDFYPSVGKQVIILPTDSELDEKKYDIIRPYIHREYRLNNDDGESSSVEQSVMYPAA